MKPRRPPALPKPSPWLPLEPGETFTVEDGQRLVYRKGRQVRSEKLPVVSGPKTR